MSVTTMDYNRNPSFILKANENAVKSMPYDVLLSNMNILLIVNKISHIPNKGFTTREPLLLLLYL